MRMKRGKKTGGGPMHKSGAKGRAPSTRGPKTGGKPMGHGEKADAMERSAREDFPV